jgi:hypothetical protein
MTPEQPEWNETRVDGVLVLGMHRSGTSLVAGSLHLLGLATCAPEDLLTGMPWNPAGHWEARSLSRLNDELLAEMGRSWWYPPPSGAGYSEVANRLATTPEVAAARFRHTYRSIPWGWKDPRIALLLPFWRRTLGESIAAVVVHRDPLEVARSLELRNGFPLHFGMALWARYNRLLLEQCRGLSVLVVRFDQVVEDPEAWIDAAQDFLDGFGAITGADAASARSFVEPTLRHVENRHSVEGLADPGSLGGAPERDLVLEVELLRSALVALEGAHASFDPPSLECERSRVEAELSARWPDLPPIWNDPPWSAASRSRVGSDERHPR